MANLYGGFLVGAMCVDGTLRPANPANFSLDQTTDSLAFVFQAPPSAPNITKVAIRLGVLTGNSPTYRLSLQGVDATTGYSDGTVKGGGSPASVTFAPASGGQTVQEYTLTNAYQTTAGEHLALVVDYSSGTIDGSNFWSFTQANGVPTVTTQRPYSVTNNNGTYAKAVQVCYGISNGTTWWGMGMWNSSTSYGSTLNTYYGNKFTLPAGMGDTVSCAGVWSPTLGQSTAGDLQFLLIGTDGTTVLADTTVDKDTYQAAGASGLVYWDDGPVTLTCGSTYRIVTKCLNIAHRFLYITCQSASHQDSLPFGQDFHRTSCTVLGTWTDTTTDRQLLGPIISDITEPTGGSGGLFGATQFIGLGR